MEYTKALKKYVRFLESDSIKPGKYKAFKLFFGVWIVIKMATCIFCISESDPPCFNSPLLIGSL